LQTIRTLPRAGNCWEAIRDLRDYVIVAERDLADATTNVTALRNCVVAEGTVVFPLGAQSATGGQ